MMTEKSDLHFIRTNSSNPDFQALVKQLDEYLAIINGEANDFFVQHNKIDHLNHVIVVYKAGTAVGCGALKEFDASTMEIKRMFVDPKLRRSGIGKFTLAALENWALDLEYRSCKLETSKRMLDAVGLYKNSDYRVIDNYGQYKDVEGSICFEKVLTSSNDPATNKAL